MSDEGKIQKRSRRRRRHHEDGASTDSGSESDTIFEEVSEYESAEDRESDEEKDARKKGRRKDGEEQIGDETGIQAAVGDEAIAEVLVEEVDKLHISADNREVPEEIAHEEVEIGDEDGAGNEVEEREKMEDAEDSGEEEAGEAVDSSTIDEPKYEDEQVEEQAEIDEEEKEEDEEDREDEENQEDEAIEEKRSSGDGQEEPSEENAVELDDDEDLKNPAYIPRKGAYYQHDVRMGDDNKGDKRQKRERKLWKGDDNLWLHDKYDETQQGPKSQYDIVNYYGFDIRDPTQQDRLERDGYDRRRGRGRGGRGGRRNGPPRGRGRGRTFSRSFEEDGGGDRGQEIERRGYSSSKTTERRNIEKDGDFPQLPSRGGGDENDRNSRASVSYADRVKRGQQRSNYQSSSKNYDDYDYEGDKSNIRIPYQSEKTYYEKDSIGGQEESFKNVSSDYRYRPSRGRSNQEQIHLSEGSAPITKSSRDVETKSYSHSYSEHSRRRTQPGMKEKDHREQNEVYPLEFVNKNYQRDSESRVDSSSLGQQGDIRKEEELSEQELQESSRKSYSVERHQRSRGQTDSNEVIVQESQSIPHEEEVNVGSKQYMHLRNLKIQLKGSERTVVYQEDVEEEEHISRTNQPDNNEDEDQENQRNDRRERSRPKRYSSQRQRGQDVPQASSQQYYTQGFPGAGDPSRIKGDVPPHQTGHPHPQRSSGQGHLSRQQGGGSPGGGPPSGLPPSSSSMSPSIQNLMQQGMMMPPEDPMSQGVRPPHLPSPAFFQQHQGNLPPAYYVGPMVNYGAPQYPMGTPLQYQHYPISMAHSPQGGVAPPAAAGAPPPPQNSAVPSSSQNPSVQQVGGVTYYSPMQQPPLQMRHLPPKRQSKPLTIESPP